MTFRFCGVEFYSFALKLIYLHNPLMDLVHIFAWLLSSFDLLLHWPSSWPLVKVKVTWPSDFWGFKFCIKIDIYLNSTFMDLYLFNTHLTTHWPLVRSLYLQILGSNSHSLQTLLLKAKRFCPGTSCLLLKT